MFSNIFATTITLLSSGLLVATKPCPNALTSSSSANAVPSSSPAATNSTGGKGGLGTSFQATITGYQDCGTAQGSCGFVASPGAYTGAVSVYWKQAGLPGQCGTCWQIHDAANVDVATKGRGPAITTPPITVMITNTCAPDKSKPGFQCNQQASAPKDMYGSVTVVDLCVDTGAPKALWGESGAKGGLALATITQVDCQGWEGSVGPFADWSDLQATSDGKGVVKKGGKV